MRLLLTPRWLQALAVAAVFAAVCIGLGRWQYSRHVEVSAEVAAVQANYAGAVSTVDAVLPAGSPGLAPDRVWSRVQVTGRYQHQGQLLVRNRPRDLVYGYEVLVPLLLSDGTAVLVDRGWLRNAERADLLPPVPAAPTGPVTVTGWARAGEPDLGRDLPPGQLASINVAEAAARTGLHLRPGYLIMQQEQPASGQPITQRPQPLLEPDTSTGPHFAYALQWWLAAPVGFVLVGVFARRELRESAGSGSSSRPSSVPDDPRPTRRPARVGKPAKVRIWDEEDE